MVQRSGRRATDLLVPFRILRTSVSQVRCQPQAGRSHMDVAGPVAIGQGIIVLNENRGDSG